MAFNTTREYNLITFDEVTTPVGRQSTLPTLAEGQLSPNHDELPSWRPSTPAETGYGSSANSGKSENAVMSTLCETLWRVERGLSAVEERIQSRESRFYEVVGEIESKLSSLEVSQKKREEELNLLRSELVGANRTCDHGRTLGPSLPQTGPQPMERRAPDSLETAPLLEPERDKHPPQDVEDELFEALERIDELAREKEQGNARMPAIGTAPTGAKPRIRPTPFDGMSSWDDYRAQIDLVAELNGWDSGTKAIYLAASLQGPARTTLGDLDPNGRRDLDALTEALESRFGSKHQTEMYRAQLRCRTKKREETIPELAQAIQRLVRQAYPSAPASMRETLAKDYFSRDATCAVASIT